MKLGEIMFGGFQKTSLIDYPGTVSCVIFLSGCNLTCPYCHNPELVRRDAPLPAFLTKPWIMDFLAQRAGLLDGVVITGGEPTLSKELLPLCRDIKKRGFKVKVDTNGTNPHVVQDLLEQGLADYLAMDIKTGPQAYAPVFSPKPVADRIMASIDMIMRAAIPYEFRTTCVKPLFDADKLQAILNVIPGARRFVLQQFHAAKLLNPAFFENRECRFSDHELRAFQKTASGHVEECLVR